MLNYYCMSTYRAYKKHWDLRAQIDLLRATTEDKLSERADSEISDEVDQGLISLVDKSTIYFTYLNQECNTSRSCTINGSLVWITTPGQFIGSNYQDDFLLAVSGTGSISSGSAKSISTCRSESRLDDSFSSSASFPNSPVTLRKSLVPQDDDEHVAALEEHVPVAINGTACYKQPSRSRSEETFSDHAIGKRLPNLEEKLRDVVRAIKNKRI